MDRSIPRKCRCGRDIESKNKNVYLCNCHKEYRKKWRNEYPEKYKAQVERRRVKRRESGDPYYHKHKEEIKERRRAKRAVDNEKDRERSRQWKLDHPEQVRERKAIDQNNRRARKNNGGKFTKAEWSAMKNKYDNKCLCCKEEKPLTIDHVTPISRGGTNAADNIQPLCLRCNVLKMTKTVDYR